MKPATMPLLTEAEYEALPASIQRKYFSSLERLRIVENSACSKSRTPSIAATSSRSSSRSGDRGHSLDLPSKPLPSPSSGGRMWKLRSSKQDNGMSLTHADAHWYLSLPEKVRRRMFSPEEQALLGNRCEGIVGHQNRGAARRWSDRRDSTLSNESSGTTCSHRDNSVSIESLMDQYLPGINQPADHALECNSHTSLADNARNGASKKPHGFRSNSLGTLSLSQPPPPIITNLTSPSYRSFSASTLPSQRSVLFPRKSSEASVTDDPYDAGSTTEGKAIYYQDPEARMKMKNYLASPQKFDEVIEFGFPTIPEAEPLPTRPVTPPFSPTAPRISADVQRFCKGDTLSYMGDDVESLSPGKDDDELSSLADSDGPGTPSDSDPISNYMGHLSPSASNTFSPTSRGRQPSQRTLGPVAQALAPNNREMTLKLTLTRPELRNGESRGPSNIQQKSVRQAQPLKDTDPLALAPLPFTDDVSGACGAFAVHPKDDFSLVQKVMSKIKKTTK